MYVRVRSLYPESHYGRWHRACIGSRHRRKPRLQRTGIAHAGRDAHNGPKDRVSTMPSMKELEAKLAELEAQAKAAEERAAKAEALAAASTKGGKTYSGITCKVSENAKVLSIYGMQSRPVSLYASQFVKLFGHADEIKAFILANADALAWKSPEEKQTTLAAIRPAASTEAPAA